MAKLIKPNFIDPLGDPRLSALSVSPPLRFRNVKSRVFPLKANISALTNFCNAYLNMDIPPEIVHYAPGLPFVYLLVLNYGNMSTASIEAQNVGWVAQHEVLFLVPLQVWREEAGELVFKGFTTISPFIYVDDQFSLNVGREVYGWNKVACSIDAGVPLWIENPRASLRQLDLGVVDFEKSYAGESQSLQPLLQIDLDPPPSLLQFPLDLHNPWLPMWSVPNAIANAGSLIGDAVDTALALRIRGNEPHRSVASLLAMGGQAAGLIKKVLPRVPAMRGAPISPLEGGEPTFGLPELNLDTVTLKQFRNPENQGLACYQALVHAPLGCDRLNGIGMLGDVNYLRGDTTGGYRININHLDTQPIIETLGLEVASWSNLDAAGGTATLKPVLPFWLDVDLFYGKGEVVCSRAPWGDAGPRGGWVDEREAGAPKVAPKTPAMTTPQTGKTTAKTAKPTAAPAAEAQSEPAQAKSALPPYYNTALGAATQPIAGPFHFPDVTLQVYPFLADQEKLRAIIDKHLNDPLAEMYPHGTSDAKTRTEKGWRFKPLGSYVYMMVTVYGSELGKEFSSANNIGGFFDREVTFCVPVKWFDNKGNLMSVAMIEPFTYSNSGRGVVTDREIVGYNSIRADIASPQDIWMAPNGPVAPRAYLKVTTEALPALNVGQKARQCTLIEIDERSPFHDHTAMRTRDVADTWSRAVIDELKRKTFMASTAALASASYWDNPERGWPAGGEPVNQVDTGKALGLELLTHGQPFNRLIYKQYRDSADTGRACYQALVHATTTLTSVYDVREIENVTHVRFHRQAGHPIVDAFGLKIKATVTNGSDVIDVLQPVRPFWLRVAMREDLATVACYRAADEPWSIVHPWYQKPDTAVTGAEPFKDRDFNNLAAERMPYFLRDTPTRVGGWLGSKAPEIASRPTASNPKQFPTEIDIEQWLVKRFNAARGGASLHRNLKNEATQWLRESLVNELTWIRVQYDAEQSVQTNFPDSIAVTRTGKAVLDFLKCPIAPSAVQDIADRFSIDELVDIVNAIRRAVPQSSLAALEPPKDCGEVARLYGIPSTAGTARAAPRRTAKASTTVAAAAVPGTPTPTDAFAQMFPNRTFADDDSRQSEQFYQDLRDVLVRFNYFMAASTGSDAKTELVWAWDAILEAKITHITLQLILQNFCNLAPSNRQAFLLSIPQNAMALLKEAASYRVVPQSGSGRRLQASIAEMIASKLDLAALQTLKDDLRLLRLLADTLQRRFLDWHYASRWRRLSTTSAVPLHNATMAIDNLEEVQLIVENMLSCEWENHGATRWENPNIAPKPSAYIVDDPAVELDATAQGLSRWRDPVSKIESEFWIAPVALISASST